VLTHVPIPPVSPERYRPVLGDGYAAAEAAIAEVGRSLSGRVIWHVNSTARGGGVAEMLHSLLAYARGAGADARWVVIEGDPEFFRVTKRLHNHLHGDPGDGGELGEPERALYERNLARCADELGELVRPGDIVYLHDPQTAGLVETMSKRGARVIWRCHIGLDAPNDLMRAAWDFLYGYIVDADAYVFSRRAFVWDGLDQGKIWVVHPSIDAFSPKNEEIDPETVHAIIAQIGLGYDGSHVPSFTREDGSVARVDRVAELDQDDRIAEGTPLVVQVSRWDRLKDHAGVLAAFANHVRHPSAHLLLAGPSVSGVSDDPEGADVLEEVRARRAALRPEKRARIHLASLPMVDAEENAVMVNAIQRRADVIVQKSLAEGFGLTVAEAMWKSKPVVASRIGGIQDQIADGESGVLLDDPRDLEETAAAIDGLLADPERASRIADAAHEQVKREFLATRHLIQYVQLITQMLRATSSEAPS
jgi:trehalose synthase